ncbi:MAG: hypothetical protein K0S20_530 [Patescibacteria group bacterium]|jgi:hypothetical protein|nr:hypothetical protein [Patescibacteria group bacterium]
MANNNSYNKKRRNQSPAPEQAVFENILKALWDGIVWLFRQASSGSGKEKTAGNRQQLLALQEHWQQVEFHALQENSRSLAVSEGDKILDNALKLIGVPGQTMGDRLKASENRFSRELYQDIWNAHKLRNALAHEVGVTVSSSEAQQAVNTFRQALYQLGVLS